MVAQFVNGMEGKDRRRQAAARAAAATYKTITTLKHYAANNSEVNRRTGSSDMDDRTLREYYTAPVPRHRPQAPPGLDHELLQRVNGDAGAPAERRT